MKILHAAIFSLLCFAAAPADAKQRPKRQPAAAFTAISPVFGQLVMFSQPANFVVAFEQATEARYIREAVPKGETVDKWTEMITVTGAKGLAAKKDVTPQTFAADIAAGFKKTCPDTITAKSLGSAKFGDQDAFIAIASCGIVVSSADKHSETALIIAVKGASDYYTIQWAERTEASAENLTIDEPKWRERLARLMPIRFCPIVPGEKAPFPSCISRE